MKNHIDIAMILDQVQYDGPIWSTSSEQLNVNLLRLPTGDAIPAHVNNEVDVVFVIFDGNAQMTINDELHELSAAQIVLVPCGALRSLHCTIGPLVYLTCHKRRAGLMPQ